MNGLKRPYRSWSSPARDQSLSSSLRSESVSEALDCSELVPGGAPVRYLPIVLLDLIIKLVHFMCLYTLVQLSLSPPAVLLVTASSS